MMILFEKIQGDRTRTQVQAVQGAHRANLAFGGRRSSAVQPSGAPLKRFNRSDALSDVLFIGAALLASIGAVGAVCLFALLF